MAIRLIARLIAMAIRLIAIRDSYGYQADSSSDSYGYQVAIRSPQQLPADSYGIAICDSSVIAQRLLSDSYHLVATGLVAGAIREDSYQIALIAPLIALIAHVYQK